MLSDLVHFLLEEQVEFTVSPQGEFSVVRVTTDGLSAQGIHDVTGYCVNHGLSANLTPDHNITILAKEGE